MNFWLKGIIKGVKEVMNTEQMYLLVLFCYMFLNVITDITKLKTYNKWHLLIIFFLLVIVRPEINNLVVLILTALLSLFIGILQSKIPHNTLGAGDIKMFMVVSMYLVQIKNYVPVFILVFTFHLGYMIFSLFILFLIKLICLRKKETEWGIGSYKVTNGCIVTPEAVPIFISIVFVLCIF